jgi:homocysteine S-methyltransferase
LSSHPEAIRDVHLSYLEAGSDCIISSGYQASIPGFIEEGFSSEEASVLIEKAVQLAIEARDIYCKKTNPAINPIVAAGLGPYGAYLADGSEYTGNYGISDDELYNFHQQRWDILRNSNADLLACETIPGIQEAHVLHRLIQESPDTWVMISFSCKNGTHVNDGTPLREITSIFENCQNLAGIGVNCTSPAYMNALIGEAKKGAPSKYIVVYPNSGENYNAVEKKWYGTSDPLNYCMAAVGWYNKGARIVGGCCRTGPDYIREIRMKLK